MMLMAHVVWRHGHDEAMCTEWELPVYTHVQNTLTLGGGVKTSLSRKSSISSSPKSLNLRSIPKRSMVVNVLPRKISRELGPAGLRGRYQCSASSLCDVRPVGPHDCLSASTRFTYL